MRPYLNNKTKKHLETQTRKERGWKEGKKEGIDRGEAALPVVFILTSSLFTTVQVGNLHFSFKIFLKISPF